MDLDVSDAITTARTMLERLEALQGMTVDLAPARQARLSRVEVNQGLLRLANDAMRLNVQIMDAYFATKVADK